jgi:hypothetical protein
MTLFPMVYISDYVQILVDINAVQCEILFLNVALGETTLLLLVIHLGF